MKRIKIFLITIVAIFFGLLFNTTKIFANNSVTLTYHEQKVGENLPNLDATGDFGPKVYPGKVIFTHIVIPTSPNYTFNGWTYTVDGVEKKLKVGDKFEEDTDFYANWTLTVRTVRYELNGGENDEANPRFFYGTETKILEPAEKDNQIFVGWYNNSSFEGNKIEQLGYGMKSVTLYAKWANENYTVTYDGNGGTATPSTQSIPYDTTIPVLATATRTGYSFVDWYFNGSLFDSNTKITEDITLVAQWSINEYTISFNSNGGSAVGQIKQDYNTAVTAPANPTKTGYTFDGWYSDAGLTTAYTFTTMPAEDITLYAKWTANKYTVTFDSNGGDAPSVANKEVTYDQQYGALATTSRTGYTFKGWFTQASGGAKIEATNLVTTASHQTLYAQWEINQYTISFNSNGGSSINPITQNYNTNVSAPTPPTKTGYDFAGWYSDVGLTIAYSFTTMPAENITLYAKWTTITYTITYNDLEGQTNNNPPSYTIEDTITLADLAHRVSHTFVGWFDAQSSGNQVTQITNSIGNLTLYARWQIRTYTVTFKDWNDSTLKTESVNHGSNATAPADPTRTGYTFTSWDKGYNNVTQNLEVNAEYSINQYTITFDTDGGTAISPITQDYGSAVTAPADPTKANYEFDGWDQNIPSTMPAENLTITAIFTQLHTITFYSRTTGGNGRSTYLGEILVRHNELIDGSIVYNNNERIDSRTWYTTESLNVVFDLGTPITASRNLYYNAGSAGGLSPFLYSVDEFGNIHFEHEPFMFSMIKAVEDTSYGTLRLIQDIDGIYYIQIIEEGDSLTALNSAQLFVIDYESNQGVIDAMFDVYGNPHTIKDRVSPIEFVDQYGYDFLSTVIYRDDVFAKTEVTEVDLFKSFTATFERPNNNRFVKLMVTGREPYDAVQVMVPFLEKINGPDNLWWLDEALISNPYAQQAVKNIFDSLEMKVQVWDGVEWITQASIEPRTNLTEELLVELDLDGISSNEVKVRLLFAGYVDYGIDYIAMDFSENVHMVVTELNLVSATFNGSTDIYDSVKFEDDQYVYLNYKDTAELGFAAIPLLEGYTRTLGVSATGYIYVEGTTILDDLLEDVKGKDIEDMIDIIVESNRPELILYIDDVVELYYMLIYLGSQDYEDIVEALYNILVYGIPE